MSDYHDPAPSSAYDGADTPEAMRAVNRAEHARVRKATKTPKGHTLPQSAWEPLAEDYRRAWVRYYASNRQSLVTVREGGMTFRRPRVERTYEILVCATCGVDKPENKFPTISGKPGVRETTCRECKQAGVAARRMAGAR